MSKKRRKNNESKNTLVGIFDDFAHVFSLTGCLRRYEYSFAQSIENVEKVEICEYDDSTQTRTVIAVLDEENANSFLNKIDALKCKHHSMDPPTTYGLLVVYISYTDGTAEVIGLENVAQVDKDGSWHGGYEYFDAASICYIIFQYVDMDLLPDLSTYFN